MIPGYQLPSPYLGNLEALALLRQVCLAAW
jgi:hypothetical protein